MLRHGLDGGNGSDRHEDRSFDSRVRQRHGGAAGGSADLEDPEVEGHSGDCKRRDGGKS